MKRYIQFPITDGSRELQIINADSMEILRRLLVSDEFVGMNRSPQVYADCVDIRGLQELYRLLEISDVKHLLDQLLRIANFPTTGGSLIRDFYSSGKYECRYWDYVSELHHIVGDTVEANPDFFAIDGPVRKLQAGLYEAIHERSGAEALLAGQLMNELEKSISAVGVIEFETRYDSTGMPDRNLEYVNDICAGHHKFSKLVYSSPYLTMPRFMKKKFWRAIIGRFVESFINTENQKIRKSYQGVIFEKTPRMILGDITRWTTALLNSPTNPFFGPADTWFNLKVAYRFTEDGTLSARIVGYRFTGKRDVRKSLQPIYSPQIHEFEGYLPEERELLSQQFFLADQEMLQTIAENQAVLAFEKWLSQKEDFVRDAFVTVPAIETISHRDRTYENIIETPDYANWYAEVTETRNILNSYFSDLYSLGNTITPLVDFYHKHKIAYEYPAILDDSARTFAFKSITPMHLLLRSEYRSRKGKKAEQKIQVISSKGISDDLADSILVFTGQNAAGKSTLLLSLGLTVYLGQAGLPVPASGVAFSPMQKLCLVTLDEGTSQSTTEGALRKLNEIAKAMKDHQNESVLHLYDEMGTGTDVSGAVQLCMGYLRRLAEYPGIVILTTQIPELAAKCSTELGAQCFQVNIRAGKREITPGVGTGDPLLLLENRKKDFAELADFMDLQEG